MHTGGFSPLFLSADGSFGCGSATRGWEIGLRDGVNVFRLTCVGVGECVGGIWLTYNEELIEGNRRETASLLLVDGTCSEGGKSHLTALCVCLHPRREEHKDKGAGLAKIQGSECQPLFILPVKCARSSREILFSW